MSPKNRIYLFVVFSLLAGIFCFAAKFGASRPSHRVAQVPNASTHLEGKKLSHEETLRWVAEQRAWRRARKTKPIWARAVEPDEVGKEFQTADHAVEKARAGFWLCVGVAGEPWFQTLENIEGKYESSGDAVKTFGFDAKSRTYRIFKPKATTRNWVARVEGAGIVGFFVQLNYDPAHPLYSPAGGYVVRDGANDPYEAKPADVWLVQKGLFESTYELTP